MVRSFLNLVNARFFGWLAVIALGGAMALAQESATASGRRTDGQIEMDVVRALDGSEALKNDLITAATIQTEVTLSGTVASDSSRQLAESIAKTVPGVSKVHNNLKVGNPADDANAQGVDLGDQSGQDVADNQQGPDNQGPDNVQNAPPDGQPNQNPNQDYGQNQPPEYGQDPQQPGYAQNPPPGYGQNPPPSYGRNAPPPGYGQNYPPPPPQYPQQPQYGRGQLPPPRYEMPRGPITVPPGTLMQVRTNEPVSSKQARGGEPIQFTLIQDVVLNGVLAIPRGATVHGVIAEVRHPEKGSLTGSAELALELTSLDLTGRTYSVQSDLFKVKGPGKGQRSAGSVVGGALLGAIIGGAVGHGPGAAIGAVAGGGAGAAASAATSGPGVWIPAEALVSFHLVTPVTVEPVNQQEAMRLAQGLYPGGPALYRRPPAGYPYRPYYYAAPVYYRPYYTVGGYYYWR